MRLIGDLTHEVNAAIDTIHRRSDTTTDEKEKRVTLERIAALDRELSSVNDARSDVFAASIDEVLITGCRDTQTSADAYIRGSYNGALTYALVSAIREAKGKLSNRELHARAIGYLKKENFDQVLQLEARKAAFDRSFLV
jgi:hypothetical protein